MRWRRSRHVFFDNSLLVWTWKWLSKKDLVLADKENNRAPRSSEKNPPLVFVHGSYHAAWCWDEHWLPFFSRFGFDCYSVSLLGQITSLSFPSLTHDRLCFLKFDFWILGFLIIVMISVLSVSCSYNLNFHLKHDIRISCSDFLVPKSKSITGMTNGFSYKPLTLLGNILLINDGGSSGEMVSLCSSSPCP